jgi:hypothetical protein
MALHTDTDNINNVAVPLARVRTASLHSEIHDCALSPQHADIYINVVGETKRG